jgi:hypothetical protein
MDDNPYQSPDAIGPAPKRNPFVVAACVVLVVFVAFEVLLGGIIKTFVWGIKYGMHWQFAYGVLAMATGALMLDRLVRYFWKPVPTKPTASSVTVAAMIWMIIAAGLFVEVVSVLMAFRK